jgi:hypothetical protein
MAPGMSQHGAVPHKRIIRHSSAGATFFGADICPQPSRGVICAGRNVVLYRPYISLTLRAVTFQSLQEVVSLLSGSTQYRVYN